MAVSDFSHAGDRLGDAAEAVWRAWYEASDHWRDANSEAFEAEHLHPLMNNATEARAAIQRLQQMFSRAHSECESW